MKCVRATGPAGKCAVEVVVLIGAAGNAALLEEAAGLEDLVPLPALGFLRMERAIFGLIAPALVVCANEATQHAVLYLLFARVRARENDLLPALFLSGEAPLTP